MKYFILIFSVLVFAGCSQKKAGNPVIKIQSDFGDILVELYQDKAPKTATAFLGFVDAGMYTNTTFYRVLKADEMPNEYNTGLIQGGLWPNKKEVAAIPHESTETTGILHKNGIISLANSGAGTATTEFFICIGEQRSLDAGQKGTADNLGFSAFGKVIEGMDIIRKIQAEKSTGDKFDSKIKIKNITRN